MKKISLIISLLFTITLFGQSIDSLGIENNVMLNRQEIDFLNTFLKNSRDTFDFADKKIAFVNGSTGSKIISKQYCFQTCIKPWLDKNLRPQIFFVRLTSEEKQKSNGYDAIVMSWVKLFTENQRRIIIQQLSVR